jgi:nitrite reductase (cytochrome c-552)
VKIAGYLGLGVAAAVAAFLLAPLFLRRAEPPAPRGASLEQRFPAHTEAWKRPAREEPRWREKRGHAYSLKDRDESFPDDPRWKRLFTGLPKLRPLPGGCLTCHGALPARGPAWLEVTPYWEARRELEQSLGCADCHDPQTTALRLTRPGFPRAPRGHQELRALVCAQCHAEYYFPPGAMRVAYPASRGLRLEDIEAHYEAAGFSDFVHVGTGAPLVKAQHPQYELYSQGVHARSGVTCADCHMPLVRQGAVRITDHHARSPLENGARACLHCHAFPAEEMLARAKTIQSRTTALLDRALAALGGMLDAAPAAHRLHCQAQFRVDFVNADGSKGFHAPQEAARLLAEAIDLARQAQLQRGQTERSPLLAR